MNPGKTIPRLEIDRLRRSAEAAWHRFEYELSAKLLQRAHKLSPQDPRLLLDLGFQCGLRYDYAQAEAYFERAIRQAGGQTAALAAAGGHCANFSQPLLARGYYERALKNNSGAVEILVPLAEIYERLGQLDAAEEFAIRAAGMTPHNKSARLLQAIVWRRRNQLPQAEEILREIAPRPDPDPWVNARVWYELGANLDGQSRYDEAMAAFVHAKKILLPITAQRYARHQVQRQRWLEDAAVVTREMLQRFQKDGAELPASRAIAFLTGHPRSGTTLLEQVLDAHEQVLSLEETKIFETDACGPLTGGLPEQDRLAWTEKIPPSRLVPVRKNYFAKAEQFLGQPIGNRLLLDKNPMLVVRIPAIAKIFPEARFIVALRDPRDVCLSCYMQAIPPGTANLAYLELGRTVQQYDMVMDFWLSIRDKMSAPWLEVRYEDMVAGLESNARRTLKFLGLPWDDQVLTFHEHARKKIVRSPTYADVAKPLYPTAQGRWRNYQKYLEPHLAQLDPFIKAFGYE